MAPEGHHHRSTTKVDHKPYKTKHSSKGALKERNKGKVESLERGSRKTPHQQVMSKLDRRNRAKQLRVQNNAAHENKTSVFAGRDGAPRNVALIPLCDDVSTVEAIRSMVKSVDIEEEVPESGIFRVEVGRFKQKLQFISLPRRDLVEALDACRLADFVVFILSAEQEVDALGESMLRCIESQGVSNVFTIAQGLEKVEPAKRKPQVLGSLKSYITHFFATQERVHSLESRQDCSNVVRSLCTTTPKGIHWREERSWMLVEDIRWPVSAGGDVASDNVVLSGVVRGKGLKADRLVQVGDWGDFQIEKIVAAPLDTKKKAAKDAMAVDEGSDQEVLEQPTADQDDLADLAPEDVDMERMSQYPVSLAPTERRGVLLDDHHYFEDEEENVPEKPKRMPKGTSKYQSAWYLGDVSDSGSDLESVDGDDDMDMDGSAAASAHPADGYEGLDHTMREPTEYAKSEYPQSEMFQDRSPEDEAEQIAAYRAARKDEAEDDLEFPDEIELLPNVLARERLIRYRGLKSLRTSTWETEEDRPYEPTEWGRLLEVSNYKAARNKIVSEALAGGVKPGVRVDVYLRLGDHSVSELQTLPKPSGVFSLLRHEHKRTACNTSITLSSDYPGPLKSKTQLIMQCGPRRYLINPLFSQAGNTPNNVHKFDRYLHPGRTAIATFTGPLTWGSVPCLYFQRGVKLRTGDEDSDDEDEDKADEMVDADASAAADQSLTLVATGTVLPPSTSRIIAKRIILTGHPYKIHKRLVTVRYMFFNAEDVAWFKALQLWTKRGRSGFIKESLGTHGYFKATFDGKINPMDGVAVSLYKRVWPRWAKAWRPGQEEEVPELVEVAE